MSVFPVCWEMYTTLLTAEDLLLRTQFETQTLPDGGFRHREHVRLTWIYLTEAPPADVAARLCRELRAVATGHGKPERFHHTLTVAWVRIIEAARRERQDAPFDVLADACPYLLDKDTPLAFYTPDRLFSDDARQGWIEPNRKPLPAV